MGRLSLDGVAVDSTTIRARKGGSWATTDNRVKGTKVHVVVDSQSLPLSIEIEARNEHDSKRFIPLL